MVICLDRVADLHMSQLMPLPLTVYCSSKIQTGFTFPVRLTRVVPEKGPLNGCVCVPNQSQRSSFTVIGYVEAGRQRSSKTFRLL